jgi:hypothetical protein
MFVQYASRHACIFKITYRLASVKQEPPYTGVTTGLMVDLALTITFLVIFDTNSVTGFYYLRA